MSSPKRVNPDGVLAVANQVGADGVVFTESALRYAASVHPDLYEYSNGALLMRSTDAYARWKDTLRNLQTHDTGRYRVGTFGAGF